MGIKISEAFPSNYVKADDLQGKPVPVVIAGVEMNEQMGRLIVSFQNAKRQLVCNKTNANRIKFLYGDDTDNWVGKEVVLAPEFTEFQGNTVKCIRVRPPNGKMPEPTPPGLDDDIPF